MYHFIVNPRSRSGQGKAIWNIAEGELRRLNIAYKVVYTACIGHARKLALKLSMKEEPTTLVVIGGDGTINEVLSGLKSFKHLTLGYIPTGSGNDFAKGMHIPSDTIEALHTILYSSAATAIDVGRIEAGGRTYRFGISTGMGLDASICQEALVSPLKDFLNKLRLGKLTYAALALKQIFLYTPTPLTLTMDKRRCVRFKKAYFAAVMNQHCEGGGLKLCPQAKPDDRVLDVCVVASISKLKLLLLFPTAFWGKHTKIKGVHIFRCKHIHIHSKTPLPVHRDGESNGNQSTISLSIEESPLKVITPMI